MRTSLLALLIGCAPVSPKPAGTVEPADSADVGSVDSGGTSHEAEDRDGDGASSDSDCDDSNPDVHPGATEVCNGLDDDCDGTVDGDGATDIRSWYLDTDGDVYGDPSTEVHSCVRVAGYTAIGGDCDDTDPGIHPMAVETCDGVDTNCDGTEDDASDAESWYVDSDGDGFGDSNVVTRACSAAEGFVADSTDCDDTRAVIFPGAPEVCDGYDDDCDGEIDEGAVDATRWYDDEDGDGFGDTDGVTDACIAPAGAVVDATDCDDANPDAFPGASEYCNGGDDDCDGMVDEADAVDAADWYFDADADRFGDGVATRACTAPDGYAAWDGDCDDADASVNPAAVEACDTDTDLNCDGSLGYADADGDGVAACLDCDDADASWWDTSTWYADADGDGYGDPTSMEAACWPSVGYGEDGTDCDDVNPAAHPGAAETWYDGIDQACDGGSDYDADADGYVREEDGGDDCLDDDPAVNPAAVEVCEDGLDNDCDGDASACALTGDVSLADAPVKFVGDEPGGTVGMGLGAYDDATADSDRSLVLGGTGVGSGAGAAYVFRSFAGSAFGGTSVLTADATLTGEVAGDHAGYQTVGAGDVDGDGIDDFLVNAIYESTVAAWAGAVYLVSGDVSGTVPLSTASAKLLGEHNADMAGSALAPLGDVDSDGYTDFLAGALRDDTVGLEAGAAYYVRGPLSGTSSLGDAEGKMLAEGAHDYAGAAVAGGDVDGDGVSDIVVGGFYADGTRAGDGKVYVLTTPPTGVMSLASSDHILTGASDGGCFGYSVAVLDANGDGYGDVAGGAPEESTGASQAGAAYLFLGPLTTDQTTEGATWTVLGEEVLEALGTSMTSAGDVDQDGHDDLLVGAYHGTASHDGQAGLFYGPLTGTIDWSDADFMMNAETDEVDDAGRAVAGLGDLDGDGYPDFGVASPEFWTASAWEGAAYVWFGTGQ